jgi:hypothetical protein
LADRELLSTELADREQGYDGRRITALLRMPEQAPGYIVGTFIFTYATTVLGAPRNFVLMAVLVQAILGFSWVPVAGHLSDRIGRKRMYIIGSIFSGIFGFIYFALLDTKMPALIFIAIALSLLPVTTCYGPQAAMIAESFTPRLRYMTPSSSEPRTPAGKARVFDARKWLRESDGLSAGGRWIRTSGSAPAAIYPSPTAG